ncbi:MAG: glycosyl transferase, family 39 [Actinomycetia bacterium]|nr:glycosyl transferase, family 39 [Actinomycetes bacterium]
MGVVEGARVGSLVTGHVPEEPDTQIYPRVREYVAPAVLAVVMLALGLFRLGSKPLWQDEGFTWSSATLSGGKLVHHLVHTEATGGLYLVFQHFWVKVGSDIWWLRLPSVLFATAAVPVLWALTRRLFDARTATIAAALLVLNATFLDHVQEARTYPLVVLLACTSMYWFVREMESPTRGARGWWVLTTILLVFAHVVAGLVIVAQVVSLLVARPDRRRTRHVALGVGMIAVVVLPFLVLAKSQPLEGPVNNPTVRFFYNTLRVLAGGGNVLLLVEAVAVGGALWLFVRTYRAHPRTDAAWRLALPALWFGLSSLLFFLYGQLATGFQQRYLLAFVPGLFILVARGITSIPSRAIQAVAVVVVLALAAPGVWRWYDQPREGFDQIASVLVHDRRPGDVIVFKVDLSRIPVAYYLRDQPGTRRDITPVWPGGPAWMSGFRTGDYRFSAVPPAVMARVAARNDRIWVVDVGALGSRTRKAIQVLRRTHRRVKDVEVGGAPSLQLFVRK